MFLFNLLIKILSYLYNDTLNRGITYFYRLVYCEYYKRILAVSGDFCIKKPFSIKGISYIKIGDNFRAERGLMLAAWDKFGNQAFCPSIQIGRNFDAGFDCHIGAINNITIGDNVLLGSKVYITDHFHGVIHKSECEIPPIKRPLFSKGKVVIEDNVWIGDNVVIMPGVTIGKGSIVGANAVVTKSVAKDSVVAGVPAKIIKKIE